jgi:hypothetical protein
MLTQRDQRSELWADHHGADDQDWLIKEYSNTGDQLGYGHEG